MNTPDQQPPLATPSPGSARGVRALAGRWPVLAGLAAFLLLAGLVLVVSALVNRNGRPLYPNLPTFTPPAATLTGELAVLTFAELNADPDAYRDRRIQVAGDFASVPPPTCTPHAGPSIRWSLVAEELQLNAVGFENVLRLLAEGTPMTVTGIWRLYSGPAGCGKAPPDANVWFLAVDQIVEPNPLFGEGGAMLTVVAGSPLATLPPLDLTVPTATATLTLTATVPLASPEAPPATTPAVLPTIGAAATATPTTDRHAGDARHGWHTDTDYRHADSRPARPAPARQPGQALRPRPPVEGGARTDSGIPTATPGGPMAIPAEGTPGYP
jgi:hypothetical protein